MLKVICKKTIPVIMFLLLLNTVNPCVSKAQEDFYITAEDILQTQGKEPEVKFSKKVAKEIKIMEKRHFSGVNTYDSDKYRIAKLEEYLLGRTWEFLPVDTRMEKLKLASQRKALSGTSIPASLRKAGFSPKRIANDSTPVYNDDDNVGLIDGFLRLINKDAFDAYNTQKKRMYERYDYE